MFLKDTFVPILSIIFSSIALYLSVRSEKEKKFNMSIDFTDSHLYELKVDRYTTNTPDVYFLKQYRFFPSVVLTNNSSLPITVIDASLNEHIIYGSYTHVGNIYETSYEFDENKKIFNVQTYDFSQIQLIKFPVTIKPYEAVVGVMMFPYDSSICHQTNKITFRTSRGVKDSQIPPLIQLSSQLDTDFVPPQIK